MCFTLINKTFKIITEIQIKSGRGASRNRTYFIRISEGQDALRILQALKLVGPDGSFQDTDGVVHPLLIQNECCKRAFLRGAFLAGGSMSDPEKFYHFEIVCDSPMQAGQVMDTIRIFDVDAKIVERKNRYVVYVKEGTQIVDLLNIMEAHQSLMEMENVRILKDMRNQVNRQVNCETANLNKTVNAAYRQIEDIKYLQSIGELQHLQVGLQEIAEVRVENPEASLKELGEMLDPPIGKSGVNHRLKKLSQIADNMRG